MKDHAQLKRLSDGTIILLQQGFPIIEGKYGRLRMTTGETIAAHDWDALADAPTPRFNQMDKNRTVRRLMDMQERMNESYRAAMEEGNLTPDRVRVLFKQGTSPKRGRPKTVSANPKVNDLLMEFSKGAKSPLTARAYAAFAVKLAEFDPNVTTGAMTEEWRTRFFEFRKRQGLSPNALWSNQKQLNKIINHAHANRLTCPIKADARAHKLTPKVTDWLDWMDIKRIVEFVPKEKRDAELRTIALTLLLTSVRIGDLWRFYDHLDMQRGWSEFKCGKHPHPLVSPLLLLPLRIALAKYGKPSFRTEQHVRKGLQDFINMLGIGKTITPHDCRRSAITNMLSLRMPPHLIARVMSGHRMSGQSDSKIFFQYDVSTLAVAREDLMDALRGIDKKRTHGIRLL